jgi:taurine transport system permease protein
MSHKNEHPSTVHQKTVRMHTFGVGQQSTVWISAVTGVVLLVLWWIAAQQQWVSRLFLPSPAEVVKLAIDIYDNGYANASLWEHVSAIAMVLGIPLGLLMGLNRWAKGMLATPVEIYWPLPPLAYLPLLIIWLGIGETSKITLLSMAMFAPVLLSAQAGVRSVPVERVQAALSLGAHQWQLLVDVVLPSALPEILTGIRIALGVGWSTLVAAELIAATKGIGYMIMSASHFLATDAVFVGIGVIALCAFAFSLTIRLVEAWLVPWKGKS